MIDEVMNMTLEELQNVETIKKRSDFNSFVIVPMNDNHDSGFRTMMFILLLDNEILGAVSGWSDVIHVNGVGGYGLDVENALKTQKVQRVSMSMDCLPVSGCMRFFIDNDHVMELDGFIGSDFVFYFKRKESK